MSPHILYIIIMSWLTILPSVPLLAGDLPPHFQTAHGAIIRGDTSTQNLAMVFTGDDYSDGGEFIAEILHEHQVKAGFFFTGNFYREPDNADLIRRLDRDGHYLGPHSDAHLLYCPWENRDSLLVTRDEFHADLQANYRVMEEYFEIHDDGNRFFIPPYEWYNDSIAAWSAQMDVVLFNFSPGTITHADYTTPEMKNYRTSDEIYHQAVRFEQDHFAGLNGFILLIHIGTHPDREDKFYHRLPSLIQYLRGQGYTFQRIDSLLHRPWTDL